MCPNPLSNGLVVGFADVKNLAVVRFKEVHAVATLEQCVAFIEPGTFNRINGSQAKIAKPIAISQHKGVDLRSKLH
jgi:hypothetical protein